VIFKSTGLSICIAFSFLVRLHVLSLTNSMETLTPMD